MALGLYNDTIVAPSTPVGTSALAMIRVSGRDAVQITARLLAKPELLWVAIGGSHVYANILDSDGNPLDDVVLQVHRAPKSFTGEDLIEISTHGSSAIESQLVASLVRKGARLAEPGEFSRRAYLAGKLSLREVEQILDRVNATSEPELHAAALAGAEKFSRLEGIYDKLLDLIAHVDAEIDFGETDHVPVSAFEPGLLECETAIDSLLANSVNRAANAGVFAIALTGPPNVGKSSIFNALLRFERSIVSSEPGTTRDYLEAFIDIEGVRVKLTDTAGLREAAGQIEERGIELGAKASLGSDVTLLVTDPSNRFPVVEPNVILLHNKVDLDGFTSGLSVSALTGEGFEAFDYWLRGRVRTHVAELSKPRIDELERATLVHVRESLRGISAGEPIILSEQLRAASLSIGELLGHQTSQESLDRIFSRLCIGK